MLSFKVINHCRESNIIIEVSVAKGTTLKREIIPEATLKPDSSIYYNNYPAIYSQNSRFLSSVSKNY